MKRKNRDARRGFTLAELAVVLAVLAIVTTMVVSFDALMHHRREVSQAKLDAMNDIKLAEVLIENYIEKNEVTIDNGRISGITYENNELKAGTSKVTLEKVTDITFVFKTENTNGKIYFCTIDYTVPGKDAAESYTFCVTIGGGEG